MWKNKGGMIMIKKGIIMSSNTFIEFTLAFRRKPFIIGVNIILFNRGIFFEYASKQKEQKERS